VHALAKNLRPAGVIAAFGCCIAFSHSAAADAPAMPMLRLASSLGSAGDSSPLATLRSPIPGARITSPFGWRIHPILKVRRFHSGVDLGAPVGTPVQAAGDGVIESMGRESRFGRVLRIRHSNSVETAYSHLASFARGLQVGSAVNAGDVIGKVGHSGWSTGPHLDYEVIVDGRSVDPARPNWDPPLRLLTANSLVPPALQVAASPHEGAGWGAP
jgi:murein DD-endopeptidase MepM/ murein hydrolase activator NlpD